MLEITRKNCYKCDLQTIILNDSQYIWINLTDLEVETECNWRNIFNKHGNSSTLEYRKELTPNNKFQFDRIFTRNHLFERTIKSCKATNVEFLTLKEQLGLCPYEVICDEQEFTLMPEIQDDIEELKKENKESMKIKISDESMKIKISEESIEIKSPKKDENTTDWYDKNRFEKTLTIADSSKFNHENNIGKLKYNDIDGLINNIKNHTVSEILARKNINALNELKNADIKNKRLSSSQKELLSSFNNLLDTVLIENDSNSNNSNNINNNNDNDDVNDNTNVNDDDNDNENENVNENENQNENENYDDCEIKKINEYFKMIDESISFEDQINLFKKKKTSR